LVVQEANGVFAGGADTEANADIGDYETAIKVLSL